MRLPFRVRIVPDVRVSGPETCTARRSVMSEPRTGRGSDSFSEEKNR